MAFSVVIDLVPPETSNLVINNVSVIGEIDKPDIALLPGHSIVQKESVQKKLHRCHVIAWHTMCTALIEQITGTTLRTAAQSVFGLSEYQAREVSAPLIKQYMESRLKEMFVSLQSNVHNYYVGVGRPNMSAGGKMGAAIQALGKLYTTYQSDCVRDSVRAESNFRSAATSQQIILFRNGYDDSPFKTKVEKAFSRAEYVAFWYQIYYGGGDNSIRFAKFLFETDEGMQAVDGLIENGK